MRDFERNTRLSRDEMTALQTQRLVEQTAYAYEKSPYYREVFDQAGVSPADIRSLDDLSRLPFTRKTEIQDRFPYGMCAVPHGRIARIHSSSGSTGMPINTCYTQKDLDDWGDCLARGLSSVGVTSDDVCQVAFRYTLFTGAFGHHLGAEHVGAAVIPTSSGLTERQILMMQAFDTTVLQCTPSYAMVIAEKVQEMGVDPRSLALRVGVHGAEPMTDAVREELQQRLAYNVYRDYGLTELGGPGVSMECTAQDGYHINEDYFYPEVVDPDTGTPLPDGEIGELVFTTLVKEGSPVLRYRTRDLTTLTRETCSCGSTLARHGLILGRTDDMLICGGVNFFPTQVECVLMDFSELAPHYMIRVCTEERRDVVYVTVESQQDYWAGRSDDSLIDLRDSVQNRLRDQVGFRMRVKVVEPHTIERSEGKTKRVSDER
jgi:phenylacetate-CoA ligase